MVRGKMKQNSNIYFCEDKNFSPEHLERLFSSVGWLAGREPERLSRAVAGYKTVISAWDDDALVGLIAAMDDGEMTAYVHYLLVDSFYRNRGIGGELVRRLQEKYINYSMIVLHAEEEAKEFYRANGFYEMKNILCMGFITKHD